MLLVLALASWLSAIEASALYALAPLVARDLGGGEATVQWASAVYVGVIALSLLGFGRLGDRHGHAPVFLAGLVIFSVSSVFCALSPSAGALLIARTAQAIGAAMTQATAPALLIASRSSTTRGRDFGILASFAFPGLAAGPALGGWVAAQHSWRAIFWLNAGLSLSTFLLSLRWPLAHRPGPSPRASSLGGMGLLRRRPVAAALAALLLADASLYGLVALLPQALPTSNGESPTRAGAAMAMLPLAMAFSAPLGGLLADRIGRRIPAVAGLALQAAGMIALARMGVGATNGALIATSAIAGLGAGMFVSSDASALLEAAPDEQKGLAGGLQATACNAGMALGAMVSGVLFSAVQAAYPAMGAPGATATTLLLMAGLALAGGLLALRF